MERTDEFRDLDPQYFHRITFIRGIVSQTIRLLSKSLEGLFDLIYIANLCDTQSTSRLFHHISSPIEDNLISAIQLAHPHSILFMQDVCPYRPESRIAFDSWNEMVMNGIIIEFNQPHNINFLQYCLCEGCVVCEQEQVISNEYYYYFV